MAQQPDPSSLLRRIDHGAQARYDNVLGFTVIEHYAVYHGEDETHPVAEMTVRTAYRKDAGKTFTILSQSGSDAVLRLGLHPLLNSEQTINKPGNVEHAWLTSANYEMQPQQGGWQRVDGHDCVAIRLTPRHKAPHLVDGTLWVDAKDGSLVKMEGIASRKPSVFAGPTRMMRRYVNMNGYAMASWSEAESNSALFGRYLLRIDYRNYQLELRNAGDLRATR